MSTPLVWIALPKLSRSVAVTVNGILAAGLSGAAKLVLSGANIVGLAMTDRTTVEDQ